MFKDELKSKLRVSNELLPFALTMLSRTKIAVSGVKSVLSSSDSALKLRLHGGALSIEGEGLKLLELGGGDLYATGRIDKISFEQ